MNKQDQNNGDVVKNLNKVNLNLSNNNFDSSIKKVGFDDLSLPLASSRSLDVQKNDIDSVKLNYDVNNNIVVSTLRDPEYSEVERRGPNEDKIESIRASLGKKRLIERLDGRVDPGKGSMPSRESPSHLARVGTTLSHKTLEVYLKRGGDLFTRYCREMGVDAPSDQISPIDFVNWFLVLKISLKASSWRLYRQSVYHFIQGFPSNDVNIALAMLDNDIKERTSQVTELRKNRVKHPKRSSALKEKRFPYRDYERMTTSLRSFNRSRLARITADWIQAGLLTALRPSEWRGTDLEIRDDPKSPRGRRAWLYVINAKATNGRGTGVARTLDISNFSDEDLQVVERMVQMATEWLDEDKYSLLQNECSQVMKNLMSKLYPNKKTKYSLYSCRHQAIANWKTILTLEEIAALVGHSVTNTSVENYGKKRSAWDSELIPLTPKALPEEILKVRTVVKLFEHKTELEIKAGLRKSNDIPRLSLFEE